MHFASDNKTHDFLMQNCCCHVFLGNLAYTTYCMNICMFVSVLFVCSRDFMWMQESDNVTDQNNKGLK